MVFDLTQPMTWVIDPYRVCTGTPLRRTGRAFVAMASLLERLLIPSRLVPPEQVARAGGGKLQEKRACVCLVLRIIKGEEERSHFTSPQELYASVNNGNLKGTEQLLFIRRAHNPRDRWSGQIAFPGGRCNPGEEDYDAAVRECREEVGLDLLNPRFACIGRLDDRVARGSRRALVISPFVFVQLDTSPEVTLTLQEREVAEAFWVTTKTLIHGPIEELSLAVAPLQLPSPARTMASFLGIRTLYMPCIQLKQGEEGMGGQASLWGLTYSICNDLLTKARLPTFHERRAVATAARPLLPFRTDSSIGDLIIRSYYHGVPRSLSLGVVLVVCLPFIVSRY